MVLAHGNQSFTASVELRHEARAPTSELLGAVLCSTAK